MPAWVSGLSVEANARLATHDPVLRSYCDRTRLVAIGGLNQSPCPRAERHRYIEVLCRTFGQNQFWALGQANPVVINGLGCAGLLDRVWVDGSGRISDPHASGWVGGVSVERGHRISWTTQRAGARSPSAFQTTLQL